MAPSNADLVPELNCVNLDKKGGPNRESVQPSSHWCEAPCTQVGEYSFGP